MADALKRSLIAFVLMDVVAGSLNPLAGAAPASAAAALPVAAAKALAKYHARMAAYPKPANMIFTYSETRTGPTRIVSSTHRVYRDKDGNQRNDTIAINELPVRPPRTRTFQRATWPYFADQFNVSPADYDVRFSRVEMINSHRAFVYIAKRLVPEPFSITELALDTATGIPLREMYAVSTRDCEGAGAIDFTLYGSYVLPSGVFAQCTMNAVGQFKDAIRFSDYRFPAAIPRDVLHPSGATSG